VLKLQVVFPVVAGVEGLEPPTPGFGDRVASLHIQGITRCRYVNPGTSRQWVSFDLSNPGGVPAAQISGPGVGSSEAR
jgi:hypothetical protein